MNTILPIPCDCGPLTGTWHGRSDASSLVLFATMGSDSHLNPHNRFLARAVGDSNRSVLLFDLLTSSEAMENRKSGRFFGEPELLASRIAAVAFWASNQHPQASAALGLLGIGMVGNAAIKTAESLPGAIKSVVVIGALIDHSAEALSQLRASTLLVCGKADRSIHRSNEAAFARIRGNKDLQLLEGEADLTKGDALEQISEMAATWYDRFLVECSATLEPCLT